MPGFAFFSFFALIFLVQAGCTPSHTLSLDPAHTFSDVNVPKEGVVTSQQLRNVGLGLGQYVENGRFEVDTKELVDAMKVEGPMGEKMPEILATREPTVAMECSARRCRVVSLGENYSFVATWISIPLFGNPTIFLDEVLNLELEVSEDGGKLEICRLSGLRGKAGIMNANIDGLRYELEANTIKEFLIDTGSGGSFPHERCSPKG